MHRRTLLRTFAGAALLPTIPLMTRAQGIPDATPDAPPQHHGLPRPVVLGDGIELIDYRIYPSPDVPRIIGEIVNIGDEMVDSPAITVTFPEFGPEGFAYAIPHLPTMRPGQSNLIFGQLPTAISSNTMLDSATFGLCGPVVAGELTASEAALDLEVMDLVEEKHATAQFMTGSVQNNSPHWIAWIRIRGLVRDSVGRLAGTIPQMDVYLADGNVPSSFAFWSDATMPFPANPYLLLDGTTNYSTTLVPGTVSATTAPGCPAILPRSDE
jgi:hypothetical protein